MQVNVALHRRCVTHGATTVPAGNQDRLERGAMKLLAKPFPRPPPAVSRFLRLTERFLNRIEAAAEISHHVAGSRQPTRNAGCQRLDGRPQGPTAYSRRAE
ncbi:hypothetical protein CBM2585_A130137 [Cupriavidus taiwanensis]|nr:hypothetical protein CBM2585_A130137 [Cupriavidus taiwanensis]